MSTCLGWFAFGRPGRLSAACAAHVAILGRQTHSVRGAIAGTLKKKGHATTSEIVDGVRRYRLTGAAR